MSFLQSFSARGFAKLCRLGGVPWSNKSGSRAAAGLALAAVLSFVPPAWSGPIYQATGQESLQLPQGIEEFERAAASFRQRDYEGCFALLEAGVKKRPELPQARVFLGKMFLADNQVARGRSVLEQAAVEYPQRPEIYVIFGKLALHEGRLTEAWVVMEKAEGLARTFPWSGSQGTEVRKDLYAAMAIVAERRGDPAAAGRALSGWLALDPRNGTARRRLGQALFRQGKRADAVKELEQAARDQAGMEPAAITLGLLYSEAKDPARAAQWMEKAIEEEPRNRKGRLAYAGWLLEQDQPDKARVQAESALELDPAAAETRLLLGVIQWHLHEYEKSAKTLQQLHQESPGSFEASNYLALALAEQRGETRQRQALELAEINARLYPNSSEALETIGRVYYRLGRLDDAEKALRAAVATGKSSLDGGFWLARVLFELGRGNESGKLLQLALASPGPFAFRKQAQDLFNRVSKKP